MKKITLLIAALLAAPAVSAIDLKESIASFENSASLVDVSTLAKDEAPSYFSMIGKSLETSSNPEALVSEMFRNNEKQANIVYALAKKSGLEDDVLIALALSEGVDPASILEPTAFGFFFPPPPPPPPPGSGGGAPPPPPPPSTGGGSGSGGVSISGN
jgi:hypothetical protein